MRPVAVHLDAGLGFSLGVGVPSDVVAAVDDDHLLTCARGAFGNSEAEETGANYEKIHASSLWEAHRPSLREDKAVLFSR